ncbi:hypothetical protein ACA910_016182 [Epithemia clementina (nom. ined.)]
MNSCHSKRAPQLPMAVMVVLVGIWMESVVGLLSASAMIALVSPPQRQGHSLFGFIRTKSSHFFNGRPTRPRIHLFGSVVGAAASSSTSHGNNNIARPELVSSSDTSASPTGAPVDRKFTTTTSTTTTTTTSSTKTRKPTPYTISCPPTDLPLLQTVVERHVQTLDRYLQSRPVAPHTQLAFDEFMFHYFQVQQQQQLAAAATLGATSGSDKCNTTAVRLILDSGCGTGRSTLCLAQQILKDQQQQQQQQQKQQQEEKEHTTPSRNRATQQLLRTQQHTMVVGVDRSLARLSRSSGSRGGLGLYNNNKSIRKTLPDPRSGLEGGQSDDDEVVVESIREEDHHDDDQDSLFVRKVAVYLDGDSTHPTKHDDDDDAGGVVVVSAWLIRADLVDFWRLLYQHQIPVHEHYLLYPNPYPKKSRWLNRWYGHAIFPLLMLLLSSPPPSTPSQSQQPLPQQSVMMIRSNWKQYLVEFQTAVQIIQTMNYSDSSDGQTPWSFNTTTTKTTTEVAAATTKRIVEAAQALVTEHGVQPRMPRSGTTLAWTNFEQKYDAVEEPTYELVFSTIIAETASFPTPT